MISIDDVSVAYGGFVLLDKINFHISETDKIGLVGKNGAGKSTIMKLICGLQSPTSGQIDKPNRISIGYLPQIMEHHKGRKYSYEITETDLTVIYSTKKDVKVRQIPIENVNYIAYTMRKNKSGTVYFNFPNDYKDILKLIFAHSGIGRTDEKIFAFYDIEDVDDLLEQLKAKIGDNLRIDKI